MPLSLARGAERPELSHWVEDGLPAPPLTTDPPTIGDSAAYRAGASGSRGLATFPAQPDAGSSQEIEPDRSLEIRAAGAVPL